MVHKSTQVSGGGGGGSGTVTEVDTGTGLTGGPITTSGTIAMATNTANTLAGFNNSGVFSDVAVGSGLSLSGGTLTASGGSGTVTTTGSPATGNLTKFSGATSITNGDLSGDITTSGTLTTTIKSSVNLSGSPTTTTQSPLTSNTTIATTAYCDSAVTAAVNGLYWKAAVTVATTANIVGTYVSGVFTVTATGVDTIDGHNIALNETVLFKNQSTGSQNGLYVCTTAGAVGVQGVFTRRSDFNTSSEINTGDTVFVQEGTTNGGTSWSLTTPPPITLDTTSLTFTQVAGPGTYVAGTGLTLTGNSFALTTPVSPTNGGTGANNSSSTGVAQWNGGAYSVSTALANGTTATTQTYTDSSTKVATTAFVAGAKVRTIGFSATGTLTTGQQGSYVVFPVAGTITGWAIVANSGTATVQVWKIASGTTAPTAGNSISTSGVSLSSGTAIISSTTSDFTTTTVSANDIFAFNLSAVSGATILDFQLQITVT